MLNIKLQDKVPCSKIKNEDNYHHRIHSNAKKAIGWTCSENLKKNPNKQTNKKPPDSLTVTQSGRPGEGKHQEDDKAEGGRMAQQRMREPLGVGQH